MKIHRSTVRSSGMKPRESMQELDPPIEDFDPGEVSDRASRYDSAEDLPQGLRSDHPEDEVPAVRNPIPQIGEGEARPVVNVGEPGPSTANEAAPAEPATQRGLEVALL